MHGVFCGNDAAQKRLVSQAASFQSWALTGTAVSEPRTHTLLTRLARSVSGCMYAYCPLTPVTAVVRRVLASRADRGLAWLPLLTYFASVYGAEWRAARCTRPPAFFLRPGAPALGKACPPNPTPPT